MGAEGPAGPHGAFWGGAAGLLIAGLIEGKMQDRSLVAGPLAFGLAGAGALASGWLGASAVEPGLATRTWLGAPPLYALGGLVTGFFPALILEYQGKDESANRLLGWFAVGGITLPAQAGEGAARLLYESRAA